MNVSVSRVSVNQALGYPLRAVLLCVVLVLCVVVQSGCADMSRVGPLRDEAAALRDQLAARRVQLESIALESDDPGAAALAMRSADAIEAAWAAMDLAVQQADALLSEARAPTDPFTQTIGTLTPWLPEPVRIPVMLGAAILLGLSRAARLKKALGSVAAGIEQAKRADPDFAEAFKRNSSAFTQSQSRTARRIVDEVAHPDRPMVRLPV